MCNNKINIHMCLYKNKLGFEKHLNIRMLYSSINILNIYVV